MLCCYCYEPVVFTWSKLLVVQNSVKLEVERGVGSNKGQYANHSLFFLFLSLFFPSSFIFFSSKCWSGKCPSVQKGAMLLLHDAVLRWPSTIMSSQKILHSSKYYIHLAVTALSCINFIDQYSIKWNSNGGILYTCLLTTFASENKVQTSQLLRTILCPL